MECDGFVIVLEDCMFEFIDVGCCKVVDVMCKYWFVECLFFDVIGLDWVFVYEEVCCWEYVMSE